MNLDDMRPANYELARGITRGWGLRKRLPMFALFGLNAYVLWVAFPGVAGLVLGGAMGVFTALLVVGELWRQFQIHVLGLSPGPVTEGEDE